MAEEDKLFEILCKHKDSNPSNLNQVFDSYGCNTLEAKVPVVSGPVVDKLLETSPEQQLYHRLALKTNSANRALEGRGPRTKNRDLKLVDVGGEVVLAYGKERERSPVDRDELDDEMEEYMKERARLKARSEGPLDVVMDIQKEQSEMKPSVSPIDRPPVRAPQLKPSQVKSNPKKSSDEPIDQDSMDRELDAYMQEAQRLRAQKLKMQQVADTASRMEDFDDD